MTFRALLFDFDGTLVDTRAASWELFAETNRLFDLGLDTQQQFFGIFSGNFFRSLADHCGDEARAAAAARHFMELVRERYAPPFIPGIIEVVRALATSSTLAIVSSNLRETIERLLAGVGLDDCFSAIIGGDIEPNKTAAIERFLGAGPGYARDEVALITDTAGDVGEGRASGIRVYGVSWGMHDHHQLTAAGADRVADDPAQLLAWFADVRRTHAYKGETWTV